MSWMAISGSQRGELATVFIASPPLDAAASRRAGGEVMEWYFSIGLFLWILAQITRPMKQLVLGITSCVCCSSSCRGHLSFQPSLTNLLWGRTDA
jgi:hypothetical protein